MSKIVFLVEGLLSGSLHFHKSSQCDFLKSITTKEYFNHYHTSKVTTIAPFNGFSQLDVIESYAHPNTIYYFVTTFSTDKVEKAKAFELATIRALKDILLVVKPICQELLRKGEYIKAVNLLFADNNFIITMTRNFLAQIAKVFAKLKKDGHFEDSYKPDVVYRADTFSMKKAVAHVKKHYHIKDIGRGFNMNLDQYIATEVTPILNVISNANSKKNLQNIINESPEITEVYAILGVNHLNVLSDTFDKYKTSTDLNFPPIHQTIEIQGKNIKFHIFPDRHGYSYTYDNLVSYAKQQGLKIPTAEQSKNLATEYFCNTKFDNQETYFTDEQISFLICNTVDKLKDYTTQQCASLLDKSSQEGFELCNKDYSKLVWYDDFIIRDICTNSVQHEEL